jgi:hypothetical protein
MWALYRYLKVVNFSKAAARADALEMVNSLTQRQPFNLGTTEDPGVTPIRFSASATAPTVIRPFYVYICGVDQAWAHVMQTLISALSLNTRAFEVTLASSGSDPVNGSTPDPTITSRAFNDASQAFMNSVTSIGKLLTTNQGVYTGATFETKFDLIWV